MLYKYIIKNVAGAIVSTSVRTFVTASDAQREGQKFMNVSNLMYPSDTRKSVVAKGNSVDVLCVN